MYFSSVGRYNRSQVLVSSRTNVEYLMRKTSNISSTSDSQNVFLTVMLNKPLFLLRNVLTRIPMTILLAGMLVIVALIQGTLLNSLSLMDQERYGISLEDIRQGSIISLFTSIFVVTGGTMLFRHVVHLFYNVGFCEWVAGTRRTFILFWIFHIVVTVLYAVSAWLLIWISNGTFAEKFAGNDFGPSSGGSACLGYAISCLSARWKKGLLIAIVIGFFIKVILVIEPSNDLTHLIAFPMGLSLGWWFNSIEYKRSHKH